MPIPAVHGAVSRGVGGAGGLTPDTVVVELDEERGQMLLHVIDARDPDAVRAEQLRSYQRRSAACSPDRHARLRRRSRHGVGDAAARGRRARAGARPRRASSGSSLSTCWRWWWSPCWRCWSYFRDVGYYFDAAVALALLSFVATVAAARYLGSGGPFG